MTVPTRTDRTHDDSRVVSRGGLNLEVEQPIVAWGALPATTDAPLPWPSIVWVGSVIRHEMDGIMPVPGTSDTVPIRIVSIGVGAAATRPGRDGIHMIRLDTHRYLIAGAQWAPPGLSLDPTDELGRGRLMVDGVAGGAGTWPTIAERATEGRRRRMQAELAHVMLRANPRSLLLVRGGVPSGIGGSRVVSWTPSLRHADLPEPVRELARTLAAGQRTPLIRASESMPARYRCLVGAAEPVAAARPLAHVVTIETQGRQSGRGDHARRHLWEHHPPHQRWPPVAVSELGAKPAATLGTGRRDGGAEWRRGGSRGPRSQVPSRR